MVSTPFVPANSMLCGLFLAKQATDDGDAVAKQLVQHDTPWLLQLEFTNLLLTAIQRGSLEIASGPDVVDQVALPPMRTDPSAPAPACLLSLALRFHFTSHEAAAAGWLCVCNGRSPHVTRR